MVDKYRHLRPKRPRSCHNADGRPKVPLDEGLAETLARFRGDGYHHYECPHCGRWHIGREKQ